MKARGVRLLVVVVTTFAIGVWTYRAYSQRGVAAPGHPVVFYGEHGNPSKDTPALSRKEIRSILDRVAAQTRDSIWLIWVRPSHVCDAFIIPDETTPRIRVGRVYSIRQSEPQMPIGSGGKYMQICPTGCGFSAKLTKPPVADMPFHYPAVVDPNSREEAPMSEDEVTAIVDFVRQQASSSRILSISWDVQNQPILDISREGNTILFRFGFMHDFLWGSGVKIEIECTPMGYKIMKWGHWVS